MLELNKVYFEDCLTGMQKIDDKSIDMILADLPYGTTKCKWDIIIPFEPLWKQYNRIIRDNGAICLFSSQPFTSLLISSNLKMYRYDWYWKKSKPQNFLNAKRMPLKNIEIVSIFSKKQAVYYPQNLIYSPTKITRPNAMLKKGNYISAYNGGNLPNKEYIKEYTNYPTQTLFFSIEGKPIHPTQKPIGLIEYLIKTYTKENELVLDNVIGSGTTAIACLNTNRNYIGFENNPKYYNICVDRIENHKNTLQKGI
jgi:site-specific DNA-methyltransferase (adenine-specific)